jgi:hypothetical protein
MKSMHLAYCKITATKYKFFYQDGDAYGEFYMDIEPESDARGTADISVKDPEYAKDLLDGFIEALADFRKGGLCWSKTTKN